MPEMHLRQPELTYYTCGSFTTEKESNLRKKKKKRLTAYLSRRTR